jgi:hypothetical protein
MDMEMGACMMQYLGCELSLDSSKKVHVWIDLRW